MVENQELSFREIKCEKPSQISEQNFKKNRLDTQVWSSGKK